jgi:hypothetical protein
MDNGQGYVSVYNIIEQVASIFDLSEIPFTFLVDAAGDALEFIASVENVYEKTAKVEVDDFRGLLPCDILEVNQVRDYDTEVALVYSTDTFHLSNDTTRDKKNTILRYKIQNDYIFTNIKKLNLEISYQGLPVDDKGYPLIVNNVSYRNAVYYHILYKVAQKLYLVDKITSNKYKDIEQNRDWYIAQAQTKAKLPSLDKMEAIKNSYMRLISDGLSHSKFFKNESVAQRFKTNPR